MSNNVCRHNLVAHDGQHLVAEECETPPGATVLLHFRDHDGRKWLGAGIVAPVQHGTKRVALDSAEAQDLGLALEEIKVVTG